MREATAGVTERLRRLLSVTIQPASTATKPSARSDVDRYPDVHTLGV
jgi:hypothetical protein